MPERGPECRPPAEHSVPQCRPSAGTPCPSAGLRQALRAPVQASAGLRPGTPCPSAGLRPALRAQCRPVSAYGRALRAPVPAFGRHSVPPMQASASLRAFGRHSVVRAPIVQTSAGLASVSPMPRVTEYTCRPVPHCRCRPSGLYEALVTYRV